MEIDKPFNRKLYQPEKIPDYQYSTKLRNFPSFMMKLLKILQFAKVIYKNIIPGHKLSLKGILLCPSVEAKPLL